jgi:uncharacterized protein (TIGR02996 family)
VAVNPELEARLVEKPEIETYLVYGDWLSEHGDPRGELVAVQARLLANPGDPALRAREAALFAANPEWLGELAALPRDEFATQWFCGFLEHARILGYRADDMVSALEILERLLALPAASLLRDLSISLERPGPIEFAPYLRRLADRTPPLRSLELACPRWVTSSFAGFTVLSPCLPHLRKLAIETTDSPRLYTIQVPALRALELDCNGMFEDDYRALLAPRWHGLESLVIIVGDEFEDHAATIDDVRSLLHGTFPALRHLGLIGVPDGHELVEALVASPLVPQLETLDLSRSNIDLGAVDVLERHVATFAHLDHLDLTHTMIPTNHGIALARRFPFMSTGKNRLLHADDDIELYDY